MDNKHVIEEKEGIITATGGMYGYDVASFRFDDQHTYTIMLKHTGERKYGDKVTLVVME